MKQWDKIVGVEGLYRNANGKFYIRLTKPKKTFRSLGTEKLRDAKQRIKEFKSTDTKIENKISKEPNYTLNLLIESFVEEELENIKVSQKTQLRIKQALLVLRNDQAFCNTELNSINAKYVHKAIERISHLSNASKNYSVYALKKAFEFAEEKRWIRESAVGEIKSFRVSPRRLDLPTDRQFNELVEYLKYPIEREDKKVLLPEEWHQFSKHQLMQRMNVSESTLKRRIAETKGKYYYKAKGRPEVAFSFLFLCFTGLRMGEARKLAWKDVMDDRIIIRGTKTSSAFRFLPLFPQLREFLNSMREHRGVVKDSDNVLGRQRIDKALRRACQRVGVEYLRHHDLRHYFATKAVQSGIDMPTIAKWLGHSDGGVLAMKVYSNVMDEHAIHQSAKLNFTHMECIA